MRKMVSLLENTGDMALKRRATNIIKGLELDGGDRVLDIGCGDGYYLHILFSLDKELKLTGVDSSRYALKRARKNLKGRGVVIEHGDLMKKLPFHSNSFDKVVISEVVEHLPDDTKGLQEAKGSKKGRCNVPYGSQS